MSVVPSTIRNSSASSVRPDVQLASRHRDDFWRYWREQAQPVVLRALEAFPSLLSDRTLLLDLVFEEYKARRRDSPQLSRHQYTKQFSEFSTSLKDAIGRMLATQDYFELHPELLQLVVDFDWPVPSQIVQGFYILEELGRGALARVYLCREVGLGERVVVLKVTRGGSYEASLLGRLDHPNIVPVYSALADEDQRVSYICMPYRGRSTLQDVIDHAKDKDTPGCASIIIEAANIWKRPDEDISVGENWPRPRHAITGSYIDGVVRLALEVADALAHAHRLGILHGDLKPSNILVTPYGQPMLIDFNLAKDCWADAAPLGGTLPYMAPEQLEGVVRDTHDDGSLYDERSEIFSFGVVLYQLLTNRLPFKPEDEVTDPVLCAIGIRAKQEASPPSIRTLNPFVDRRLEALVHRCIAVARSDRPRSMDDLLGRLRSSLGPLSRVRRTTLARPKLTGVCVVAMAASSALGAGMIWTRPPYYVREYDRGLAYERQSDYRAATDCFVRSLEAQPTFRGALYQRARAEMLSGDFSTANVYFKRLSDEFNDSRGLAYAGYCFNLSREHTVAIDSYERALDRGFESAGLHNNLAVSYEVAHSTIPNRDRLAAAQSHLQKALELAPHSLVVRRNLIKLAILRATQESSYSPTAAIEHVEFMTHACPDDAEVWAFASRLYGLLSKDDSASGEKCFEAVRNAIQKGGGPTESELKAGPIFKCLRNLPEFPQLCDAAKNVIRARKEGSSVSFMDPVESVDNAAVAAHD